VTRFPREVPVLSSTVGVISSARDLGIVIVADSRLLMVDHVVSVCCSAYYRDRLDPHCSLCHMTSLSHDAAKTLLQAFISSCLDYWNSVLYGITNNLLQWLQSVQNAAARLITQTGRREHISPIPRLCHNLPASLRSSDSCCQFRRQLKTFLFVKD